MLRDLELHKLTLNHEKTVQKLYRHSSVTTTMLYQANFMRKDADEALDMVINFLVASNIQ